MEKLNQPIYYILTEAEWDAYHLALDELFDIENCCTMTEYTKPIINDSDYLVCVEHDEARYINLMSISKTEYTYQDLIDLNYIQSNVI